LLRWSRSIRVTTTSTASTGETCFVGSGAFACVERENDERWAKREDSGEHYTYIHVPDGNCIELVYHLLGLVDADGNQVEVATRLRGLRWRQLPEVEATLGKRYVLRTANWWCPFYGSSASLMRYWRVVTFLCGAVLRELQAVVILPSSHGQYIPTRMPGLQAVWEPV
jgi:hypothetical protein